MNKLSTLLLKSYTDSLVHTSPAQRFLAKHRMVILMALMVLGGPLMAAASATDNVITRFFWKTAHIGFYGLGVVVAFFGIIIPIGKKALNIRTDANPVHNMLWAVALFGAPHLLEFGIAHFNGDAGGTGVLDGMEFQDVN